MEHTDVFMDATAIEEALARATAEAIDGELEKDIRNNLEAMRVVAEAEKAGNDRSLTFRFLSAPKEILGDGKVEEILFGINEIRDGKVVDTGATYSIKCGLVITAIGYEALPIDGVSYVKGKIDNVEGRVVGTNIYTVGWAKRGPSGVIGTNKSDATDVVKLVVEDQTAPKVSSDITELLMSGHPVVTQLTWEAINAAEVAAGEPLGKPRVKAVSREELLKLGNLLA